MSHLLRRLVYLAIGLFAGIAVWPVLEVLLYYQGRFTSYLVFSTVSGAAFGAIYGGFFGAIDGIVAGVGRRIALGVLLGTAIGFVGGAIGFTLGQLALTLLADTENIGVAGARAFGWAILGIALGASEGIRRRSFRRAAVGVFGGFLGGLLGGIAIHYTPTLLPAAWTRPVGLSLFGVLVSAMYGAFERGQIAGIVRILNGPRKGAEVVLNQRRISVGSASSCDVNLSEYSNVVDRHAEIRESNGELVLYPLGENNTVRRNDATVPKSGSEFLKFGDVLQFGGAKLLLRPLVVLLALCLPHELVAQTVRPAQVDTDRLITHQEIVVWAAISDASGRPAEGLTPEDIRIVEVDDTGREIEVEVISVEERAGVNRGISFLLLVDNSGSMYDTLDGRETDDASATRIAAVRTAIRSFLGDTDNRRDSVGLASFNTFYRLHADPADSPAAISVLLDDIERPTREAAYTELFRAIDLASVDLSQASGRRALVVLSDGEEFPFARHSGEAHPDWGTELLDVDAVLRSVERDGTSVFGIDFAEDGAAQLPAIVGAGGGLTFSATNADELASVYDEIRDHILSEYRIVYRASIIPSEYRSVRLEVNVEDRLATGSRRYFSGTIFGLPRDTIGFVLVVPAFIALLLAALLVFLRARSSRKVANLELLSHSGIGTRVMEIPGAKTVIGAAADADITIADSPDMQEQHATIVRDEKTGAYTIVSSVPVTVNNSAVTKRTLSAGDVIELPGATIVFDDP